MKRQRPDSLDLHGETQVCEPPDQPIGELLPVGALELPGSEIDVADATLEPVAGGGDDRDGDSPHGLLGSAVCARAMLRRLAIFVPALTSSLACEGAAGTLAGTVRVGSPPPVVSRGNAYPGRVGSLPRPATVARGTVTDAVVYLERFPAGADSEFVAPRLAKPALAQKDQTFAPRVLAVTVGARVDFPNQDRIYHNVFSLSPARRFDLGKYGRGESRQVVFDTPGLINVYCDIHSDMEAFVLVLPHAGFARPEADGTFSFGRLPPGRYRVKVWHPDFAEQVREVVVAASGATTCDFEY